MSYLEKILGEDYKTIVPASILWAIPIIIINFALTFPIELFQDIIYFPLFFAATILSALAGTAAYAILLYFGLKSLSKKIQMKKYSKRLTFCIYVTLVNIVANNIIFYIINQEFDISGVGLLPVILMFVIPAIIQPK